MSDSSLSARDARPVRVSAERVFELARHLTERDREIADVLFAQQVLTTDQLALLFFSSRRRAQDRLLFLYRHRVVDRFYPPAPFGLGKPQAHWLLDEAGAILVDRPDFWPQLSPLGRAAAQPGEVAEVVEEAPDPAQPCDANVANAAGPTPDTDSAEVQQPAADEGFLVRRRAELEEELRSDIAAARARRGRPGGTDLRPSEIAGFMDDPEPDEEGSWR